MKTLQDRIETLLSSLVSEGKERGLQVAAYVNGQLVVNAWAGVLDASSNRPVREDTLFPVFSVSKGMASTLIHLLVERGQLSYEEPISKYWPEFGAHGKERVTVRQALNHSAGIPQMPPGVDYAQLCDWEKMCAAIANLPPLWTPGTRIEYHAMTYGWIVGEVACRVDGRPFSQLLQEEICAPLGIETMFVGMPDEVESRVAVLEEPGADPAPVDDGKPQAVPAVFRPLHTMMNRPDARRACVPASNGIMNAMAIARHYAALLPGGVDGVELLPPARIRLVTEMQKPAHPDSEDYPKDWGLGYKIRGETYGPAGFGHGGYGGSQGLADPAAGLAVGWVKNQFNSGNTPGLILDELRRSLSNP